jgi:chromosome segregation ATPase
MPKGATKQAADQASTEKKKRTILTPEQKLAKMEADLQAAREAITNKAKLKLEAADARVTQLEGQVAKAQAKLDAAKAEREELRKQAGVPSEDDATDED